jgi:hypothetical protein
MSQAPSNTIMLPGSLKGFSDFANDIREAIISANLSSKQKE